MGKKPSAPPPSSREHPPSPDEDGKGETEAGLARYLVVLTTSGVACQASLFWGRNEGGAKGQKLSQGVGEFWLVPVQSAFSRIAVDAQSPSVADSFQNTRTRQLGKYILSVLGRS